MYGIILRLFSPYFGISGQLLLPCQLCLNFFFFIKKQFVIGLRLLLKLLVCLVLLTQCFVVLKFSLCHFFGVLGFGFLEIGSQGLYLGFFVLELGVEGSLDLFAVVFGKCTVDLDEANRLRFMKQFHIDDL